MALVQVQQKAEQHIAENMGEIIHILPMRKSAKESNFYNLSTLLREKGGMINEAVGEPECQTGGRVSMLGRGRDF